MASVTKPAEKKSPFKSSRELRKFGMVMFVPLAIIAGLLFWKKGLAPQTYGAGGAAAFFLVFGLVVPRVLGPIEWAWMKFAGVLSYVMTRVILTMTFFFAMTPVGLLRRILTRDPMQLKKDPGAESYWVPVEEDGPGTRSDVPY